MKQRSVQAVLNGYRYEYHDYFVGYIGIEQHEKAFGPLPKEQKEAWVNYLKARKALYDAFGLEDGEPVT